MLCRSEGRSLSCYSLVGKVSIIVVFCCGSVGLYLCMSCLSFENLESCSSCKIGNLSRACMIFGMQLYDVDFDRPSYIRFLKQFSNNVM